MKLTEKIDSDLKEAMRAKDEVRLGTLRMLKSALGYAAIEKNLPQGDDALALVAIQKQIKQRRDSIEQFEKGGRTDLATKEKAELTILEAYMPQALSDDALAQLVEEVIATMGAKTKADLGKVMKEVLARAAGRADGKRVSVWVSSKLS